jgi:hypothetical protein
MQGVVMDRPITNPSFINGTFVFRTSVEDQERIAAYNWKAIGLLADELARRRQLTLSQNPETWADDIEQSFMRYLDVSKFDE